MKPLRCLLVLMIAWCMMTSAGCSLSPVAGGGGTETGNPVITIANAAFNALDSGLWNPQKHLVDGAVQLDPGYASVDPVVKVAKLRSVPESGDTVLTYVTYMDTVFVTSIVQSTDTIVKIDTVYLLDTLYSKYVQADTAHAESATVVTSSIIFDTVFISDTLLKYDTTFVAHTDTTVIPFVMEKSGPTSTTTGTPPVYSDAPGTSYTIRSSQQAPVSKDTQNAIIYYDVAAPDSWNQVDSAKTVTRSDGAVMWISRVSTRADMQVWEEYKDGDGDSLLYLAAAGGTPLALLNATYTRGTLVTSLQARFDAGADNLFSTTGDNRLYHLKKTTTMNGTVIEDVVYGGLPGAATVTLAMRRFSLTDSIADCIVQFDCQQGTDPSDFHQNALSALKLTRTYRSGSITRFEIDLRLQTAVRSIKDNPSGNLIAPVLLTKNRQASIDAILDYSGGVITGIYTIEGQEHPFTFSRSTGLLMD
jgi:hypothetical protein